MELKHFPSRMKCHPVIELLARICAVWKFSVLFLKVISSVNHHSHRGCVRVNVTQSSYSPRMLCTQSQGKQYFVHILLLPKNYEKYSVLLENVFEVSLMELKGTFLLQFYKDISKYVTNIKKVLIICMYFKKYLHKCIFNQFKFT